MEHILSNYTVTKLEKFTIFVEIHKDKGHFIKSFKYYEKHDRLPDKIRCKHSH